MNPLFDLLHDNYKFHWVTEMVKLFHHYKTSILKSITLTLPDRNHPFFITVDSTAIDISCLSFETNDEKKLDFFTYSSRIFATIEQKRCTTRW